MSTVTSNSVFEGMTLEEMVKIAKLAGCDLKQDDIETTNKKVAKYYASVERNLG